MGVMTLLRGIAASAQGYFFCHCERSAAIFRKEVLAMRLPQSLCSLGNCVLRCSTSCVHAVVAMTGCVLNSASSLICEKSLTIIYPTHPPRLSGFDREAQPWRVFFACHKRLIA